VKRKLPFMLELRRLRVLHAVAAHGTMAAAARALSFTGPAISQQLAALEREVGLPLLERHGRGVRLTAAGQRLVAHTELLLAQLAAAEADLAGQREALSGTVRLAAFPTAAATLVARAWPRLAAAAPSVNLELTELEPNDSLPALRRDQLDIAVAHEYDLLPRPLDPFYERHELLADPVLAALPAGHPAAEAERVDLADLAGEPWILPRHETSCHELVQRACAAAGFVPRAVAWCTDFRVALELAAAGAGAALVPRLAIAHPPAAAALRPLRTPVTRTIFAVSRRGGDRHPTVRVVLDELAAAAAEPQG
jgi:DNA-binding transcriptional LysR family regulator